MANTNPFKGSWFISFSVMRDANSDNIGYPLGRKGQLTMVEDPCGIIKSDFSPGSRSIVGGFYCRVPGQDKPLADADADGSWLGSEGP